MNQLQRQRLSELVKPKKCNYCHTMKVVACFKTSRARKCNECVESRRHRRRYDLNYIAVEMWFNAIGRTERRQSYIRKGIKVRMTKHEFLPWAIPELRKWFRSHPFRRPSLDRIDGDGHYELGNLQIKSQPSNSGKRSVNCFSQDMANRLKDDLSSGKYNGQEAAYVYGCSQATVSRIKHDKVAIYRV